MKFKFISFFAALIAVCALSTIGFAQETKTSQDALPPPPPALDRNAERFGDKNGMRGRYGKGHEGKMLRVLSELNLTDSQKQQAKIIVATNRASTEPQRDELKRLMIMKRSGMALTSEQNVRADELKTQLHQASKKMNDDLTAILTPEQQQQLAQKREEMRQRFQERRQKQQQNSDPASPSSQNQ